MPYRIRGRGHFTAPTSRSGKAFNYDGRRVTLNGDHFQLNWAGPSVMAAVLDAVTDGLNQLSTEALQYMQSIVPVDTGATRDSCFAIIQVEGKRVLLVIGAGTPYTIYIELGTFSHAAQPFIRQTFDLVVSQLPGVLRDAVDSRANSGAA